MFDIDEKIFVKELITKYAFKMHENNGDFVQYKLFGSDARIWYFPISPCFVSPNPQFRQNFANILGCQPHFATLTYFLSK